MTEKKKEILVVREDKLIDVLLTNLKDLSKRTIKNYIKYKMVEVDGRAETNPNKIVFKNSKITIYFSKREIPKIDLKILYEDDDLIVIDKPSGLLSISNSKEKEITAFHLVSDYIKKSNKKNKLFVVHRLDRDTSGVLLFSKNLRLKETLQKNWNDIVKRREYICVVEGKLEKKGTYKSYLTMNHFQIVHSTKDKERGNLAITHYETIKYRNGLSLVRVNIDTGKRNQIRVHMSEHNHPIVGDKKYGSKINKINRLALHASELILIDPRTGKDLIFKSDVPSEIDKLVS